MVDLSNLQLVEEDIQVADDAQYVDSSEFPPPLPEGVYTFQQGEVKDDMFKASGPKDANGRQKFINVSLTHKVVGGEHDGATLNFDTVANTPFERQGVQVNSMTDHLRALGDRARYRTNAEYADAIAAGAGKAFKAAVTWEAGCNHEGTPEECDWKDKTKVFRVKGARNFPANGNGKPSETIKCPTCATELQARARISRRIAQ